MRSFLFCEAFVNGKWVKALDGKVFPVFNPYDGSLLAEVADLGAADTDVAIEAAASAFPAWSRMPARHRAQLLRGWYELLVRHTDELAQLLTWEQGKPLDEARGEIGYGASYIEWFSEEAPRAYGDIIPGHAADKRIAVLKQPVGVCGLITPWNFPHAMLARKAGAALAAGCTVVAKPAEDTPLSALAMAQLAAEAGIPPGVFNVITSNDAPAVGKAIMDHRMVRKVSFTGSTEVGKILIRQSAPTVKKLSMELGGNAPFIVFEDADLEAAVQGAMQSKYRNAGQTCVCANRILVQDAVFDRFASLFVAEVRKLQMGNGLMPGVQIGPLINREAVHKVSALIEEAISRGGKVLIGGRPAEGNFYEPTVLTDVHADMQLSKVEIFGPVAPLYRFHSEEEAIALANATPFGLAAYFYGSDMRRIWRVAEALEYGMIGINTGLISTPLAPFGGIKESGYGREGSRYGLEDYLELKYLCFGI